MFRDGSKPIAGGQFCDYCPCPGCVEGDESLTNLECHDGTHICTSCFYDEPCGPHGFLCEDHPWCEHKPELAPDVEDAERRAISGE